MAEPAQATGRRAARQGLSSALASVARVGEGVPRGLLERQAPNYGAGPRDTADLRGRGDPDVEARRRCAGCCVVARARRAQREGAIQSARLPF